MLTAELSMSLDGFIAHSSDSVDHLFDWYANGSVEVKTADPRWIFHTTEASANHIREQFRRCGCILTGRRLFDYTKGWGGRHPIGVPVVVVTHGNVPNKWIAEHPEAPFAFVTDGVASAIERAKGIAGEKDVAVAGPNVIQQCINLRLLDEICINLVPVLIGEGIPFFGELSNPPLKLELTRLIEGKGVTHLYYRVKRQ